MDKNELFKLKGWKSQLVKIGLENGNLRLFVNGSLLPAWYDGDGQAETFYYIDKNAPTFSKMTC